MITLQCGNYANYIGTHFWNLQEAGFVYGENSKKEATVKAEFLEVDNDVLYREGQTEGGHCTYTPRLVTIDLKGSLGSLPQCGDLYGKTQVPSSESIAWTGGCQVFKEEPIKKNDFLRDMENEVEDETNEKDIDICLDSENEKEKQEGDLYNLDEDISFWSDYLGARFHPRSVLLAYSFQHENTTHPFDMWGLGRGAWTGCDGVGEELEDRVRMFAEECDLLGGLQIVADWQDGFGGLTQQIVDLLSDEYSGKPVLVFPCAPASYSNYSLESGWARLAGATLTISSCLGSSLVTPLSMSRDWFPLADRSIPINHISYNAALPYHSSAVLSLALDTATLPYRRRNPAPGSSLTPNELCSCVCSQGRRLAVISTDVPVSMDITRASAYWEEDLLGRMTPLLPGCAVLPLPASSPSPYSALVTLRGMQLSAVYKRRSSKFSECVSPAAYLATCVNSCRRDARPVGTFLFTKPVPTGRPFPHIFSPLVDPYGSVCMETRRHNQGVEFTTQVTGWEAGPTAGGAVVSLTKAATRINLHKVHRLGESGVEQEEWEEAVERIRDLADSYTHTDF